MSMQKQPSLQDPQAPSTAVPTEPVNHLDPLSNTDYDLEPFLTFPSSANKRFRSSALTSPTISNVSHTTLSATTSTNSTPSISSNALMQSASASPSTTTQEKVAKQDDNQTNKSNPSESQQQPQSSQPSRRQITMAARGSHWSFVEKARFEAALQKYGPFEWEKIIRAVGTRSEKQVKAYAARYRRRKKLAAQAQIEATKKQVSAAAASMMHPIALGLPRVSLPFDYSVPTYSDVTVPSTPHSTMGHVAPHMMPVLPPGATVADSITPTIIPAMNSTPLRQHHHHHQQPQHSQMHANLVPFNNYPDLVGSRRQTYYQNRSLPDMSGETGQLSSRPAASAEGNYESSYVRNQKAQPEEASLAGNLAEVERLMGNAFHGQSSDIVPSTEPNQDDIHSLDILNGVSFRQ